MIALFFRFSPNGQQILFNLHLVPDPNRLAMIENSEFSIVEFVSQYRRADWPISCAKRCGDMAIFRYFELFHSGITDELESGISDLFYILLNNHFLAFRWGCFDYSSNLSFSLCSQRLFTFHKTIQSQHWISLRSRKASMRSCPIPSTSICAIRSSGRRGFYCRMSCSLVQVYKVCFRGW